MATRVYDPGTPGLIKSLGGGRYAVQSFRNRSQVYTVDLTTGSCSCPDAARKEREAFSTGAPVKSCKHAAAASLHSFNDAIRVARGLDAEQLERQAQRTDLRMEIRAAVDVVRAQNRDRFQRAA